MSLKDLFADEPGQLVSVVSKKTDRPKSRYQEGDYAKLADFIMRGHHKQPAPEVERIVAKAQASPNRKANSALLLRAMIEEHGLAWVYDVINEHLAEGGRAGA